MLAAYYTGPGPAQEVLCLGDVPDPPTGPGQVRVRLRTSGVNPSDVKLRSGRARRATTFPLIVPHNDGAGEIVAVGEGVSPKRVGERVWIYNAQYFRPFGTAAEYVVLPQEMAIALPAGTTYEAGACFGIPLQTAYRAVTIDGDVAGQTLLIAGGAGAVGRYAIQIAKAKGATVIATVSSPLKARAALSAGADHVIDYRKEDMVARVGELTDNNGVDRLIEVNLSANAVLVPALVRPFGTVVVYGSDDAQAPVEALSAIGRSVSYRFFVVYEIRPAVRAIMIEDLTLMLHRGSIDHGHIESFALKDIARAHLAMERGEVIGNIVLDLGDAGQAR